MLVGGSPLLHWNMMDASFGFGQGIYDPEWGFLLRTPPRRARFQRGDDMMLWPAR